MAIMGPVRIVQIAALMADEGTLFLDVLGDVKVVNDLPGARGLQGGE